MSIVIPYPLEHTCDMCGCSCMAQLVGPLSDAEKANVSEAQKAFAHDGSMPPTLNPLMKGLKPDGSCLYFLNFPQKSCCFLDENLRCRIHAQFGAAHKPAACRRFPLIAIRAEDDIRIAIKPYCYANYHTCSLAPAPPDVYDAYMRSDEMRPILEDLVSSAAARPPIQSPSPRERAMACDQEREIIAWLGREKIPAAELFPALVSGNRQPQTKLPKPFLQDVSHAFAALAPTVDAIAQTLGTSVHATHVASLANALRSPLCPAAIDGETPLWRFARYALHNAVFLRETTRFPVLPIGTFALALGALAATTAQPPSDANVAPAAANILTAWMRIMAQSKLFEALIPSQQAFIALSRHC